MSRYLTPAEVVFRLIGPPAVVAPIVGRDRTSVIKWRKGSPRRAAGAIVGDDVKLALLDYADENEIPLTADHLLFGATEDELAAIAAAPEQVAAE